jgi:hypothetical protein
LGYRDPAKADETERESEQTAVTVYSASASSA